MPSSSLRSSSESESSSQEYLQRLLDSARPFLRGELEAIDENLPSLVGVLRSVGAGECWHKHGTFLEHLVDIYRILKIWKAQDSVCLCGLFHSAYSNSYVNLAIFDPSTGREVVRGHVGDAAERLIHFFCIVPRQSLIHDDLLFHYTDSELVEHLKQSEVSLAAPATNSNSNNQDQIQEDHSAAPWSWRKKLQTLVPANGITVKHIKTGEDVLVSRRVVAVFLMMTIADFSDQLFGFQDELFDNIDGRLEFKGNNFAALWPGDGKPGLWMNSISRMAAIYTLMVREEAIFVEERKITSATATGDKLDKSRDEDIELVVPPVFDKCTRVLDAKEQLAARDLYWEAVCGMSSSSSKREIVDDGKGADDEEATVVLLRSCVERNPFIGEPHVVLAQVYLRKAKFEEAEREAERGLTLMLEWGSAWDKRMSWEGWIAWARVLLMKARDRSWPQTSWGILNLGLVK
ncbi:hypothetical protein PRUPE_1G350900 [Prunus persica]|uniref:DUF6817 domain-containing protein n=2 Tax=Prunus persica TaxID=3760 RepID=M5XS09_PRUPE|nr:uncharacterized protein LOC18793279 isoform X1 [Prunus persica]XP_020421374.1 uncharacterized protein LOC18793279 isoform X2 [Prunus persica]ONI32142.1 hypothetical protein PRUPE_1G350900 [Prunus persica]ONI32143.1 hypothetical protein PRUPE_1G350900 [Prunus persica]